jgi:hypothetical protein
MTHARGPAANGAQSLPHFNSNPGYGGEDVLSTSSASDAAPHHAPTVENPVILALAQHPRNFIVVQS